MKKQRKRIPQKVEIGKKTKILKEQKKNTAIKEKVKPIKTTELDTAFGPKENEKNLCKKY